MKESTLGWVIISACLVGGYKFGKEIGIVRGKREAYNECYNLAKTTLDETIKRCEVTKAEF